GEVGGRFMDAHAAGDIEIDVVATKADAAMGLEHCKHHRQPAWVPSDDGASRRPERGRRDQRLYFDEKRPRAFDAGEDGRAGLAEIAFREEELRRIGDFAQGGARPVEGASLSRPY